MRLFCIPRRGVLLILVGWVVRWGRDGMAKGNQMLADLLLQEHRFVEAFEAQKVACHELLRGYKVCVLCLPVSLAVYKELCILLSCPCLKISPELEISLLVSATPVVGLLAVCPAPPLPALQAMRLCSGPID